MAIVLVKFGNPVILDKLLAPPQNLLELIIYPWPVAWGYLFVAILFLASLPWWRWKIPGFKWLLALPLLWFVWQLLSATQAIRPDLTNPTILHFAACVATFYIGYFALSRVGNLVPFWLGLLAGLLIVVWIGFEQHYGGLEQTRCAFEEMKTNTAQNPFIQKLDTPEFRKKIASNRIFSTLVYPNALAGAILLFFPAALCALWQMTQNERVGRAVPSTPNSVAKDKSSGALGTARPTLRKVLVALWAYAGLACLYWSGSKAGWLICLGIVFWAFLHLAIPKKIKWWAAAVLLIIGLAGFAAKYAGYFQKGATSAVARTDYWRAAWQLSLEKPWLGSGPGTFMDGYKRLKNPESEMARLAHNDYLQQAADSGWPGFVFYSAFIWGSVVMLYRGWRKGASPEFLCSKDAPNGETANDERTGNKSKAAWRFASRRTPKEATQATDWLYFAVWLGVGALATQSLVEFGLYIPALAWPFFLFLGWLWGKTSRNSDDS